MFSDLRWFVTVLLLCAACTTAETEKIQAGLANADKVLVAVQPVASDVACRLQSGANASTDILLNSGEKDKADTSAEVSKFLGIFCNNLPLGTVLAQPVSVPAPVVEVLKQVS